MTSPQPEIDPSRLEGRLAALAGIDRVRAASGPEPVYLVGGVVRDILLGLEEIANLDLVVEGDAAAVAGRLGADPTIHERFGTATLTLGETLVDLASARRESYPRPGALPEVEPASLAEDLARRDFTVNAMALPLGGPARLIDLHGGLTDLEARVLRVLHPRSFSDDPTRALRAARYAARLGLALEPGTAALLAQADLGTVSAERVEAELRRQASEDDPARGFGLMDEWGLIDLDAEAVGLIAELSRLLAAEPWSEAADRSGAILAVAQGQLQGPRGLAAADPQRPSDAVEAAHGHSGEELAVARALGAVWLDRYLAEWRDVRLEIGGEDLLAAGVERGPAIGRGLAAALRAKLDGEVSGREDELRVAREAS